MPEFLQLAHHLKINKHRIGGKYVSTKLDGTRCFYDGGLSRGLPTSTIPWANLDKKVKPVATSLWSRYGNVIVAPDWFLNQLPPFPLDGELWAGERGFQKCRSIVAKDAAVDEEWESVQYAVFDSPPLQAVFSDRTIKGTNFNKKISWAEFYRWMNKLESFRLEEFRSTAPNSTFEDTLIFLRDNLEVEGRIYLHQQRKLPLDETKAWDALKEYMQAIEGVGGEGCIIRSPEAIWCPKRVQSVLKYKFQNDDEGVLVGFTAGRETDKGSRLLGKIGALILDYKGIRLELAGLTDDEREFDTVKARTLAASAPGRDLPAAVTRSKHFRVGDKITFTYRELSDDGIPKEARFMRLRGDA